MSVGWGQDCIDGVEVELWGECYNIEETISLNLSNQGLNGQIPPEIGNLENLMMLDLSNVGLNGQIPPEIGNLENLTIVDLGHNQLTGQIPIQIGNLTNLEYLGFNHNQLIGEIPSEIGNLTNLTHIRLNYNQLIGEIPSEIGNLVNLEILKFYNNEFTFVSDSICNLTNLFWSLGNYGNYDSNIYNNNLCPPYPSCIEDYVGYQDTTDCSSMSISELIVPINYQLHQPFPNPFNPTTSISFSIPEQSQTSLKVYDIKGNLISTLLNQTMNVGHHQIEWNGENLSSGTYFIRINSGEFSDVKKVVLVK